jgi:hypothetical protein
MYRMLGLAVVIALLLVGQREANGQARPDQRPVGKIAVTASGAVSFDGATVTLDGLKAKLADLKKRNGVVWYYRQAASSEPPAQAIDVIKLVIDNQLPISMSSRPDYSDVVLPDGSTRPRVEASQR